MCERRATTPLPLAGRGGGGGYETQGQRQERRLACPSSSVGVASHPTPNPSPSRGGEQVGRNLSAGCRRSAGCACRLPQLRRSRSRRRCGSTGAWRTPRRARPPRLPPRAAPCTKSSSVLILPPFGVVLPITPCARRIDVERAFRLRALDALGLVQHRHHEIAPLPEHLVVARDEVLRTVQAPRRPPTA